MYIFFPIKFLYVFHCKATFAAKGITLQSILNILLGLPKPLFNLPPLKSSFYCDTLESALNFEVINATLCQYNEF